MRRGCCLLPTALEAALQSSSSVFSPPALPALRIPRNYARAGTAGVERTVRLSSSLYGAAVPSGGVAKKDFIGNNLTSVCVVGGGLAGLSAAYHLLDKCRRGRQGRSTGVLPIVTILDRTAVGEGGASAVAGGLLHPFSPRGKLVHLGLEGLASTNGLLTAASKFKPNAVLRDKLYRVALTSKHVHDLQQTATMHPELATWLNANEIQKECQVGDSAMGGLRLEGGCRVVHVPTYLRGLWDACLEMSDGTAKWVATEEDADGSNGKRARHRWKEWVEGYDALILAAGAGLVRDSILPSNLLDGSFPAEVVRGQSLEMTMPPDYGINKASKNEAILCGKYLVPLPPFSSEDGAGTNRVLVGATHEYNLTALPPDQVYKHLMGRSYELSPSLWDKGIVDEVTSGWRLQSHRGQHGRSPMIGRLDCNGTSKEAFFHPNAWLFTGLSSRGLIHHGIYGDILTDLMLGCNCGDGKDMERSDGWDQEGLDWWRR